MSTKDDSNAQPVSSTKPTQTAQPPFVVRFYGDEQAKDAEGRTLDEILKFDDRSLEYHHDFIQVLFPLPERSPINPSAPLITKSVQEAFEQDDKLREQLFKAFKRLASFYAFDVSGPKERPTLTPKKNFKRLASETWLTSMDHNHLRITRIIRCLRILALEGVAGTFYEALVGNESQRVSSRSLMYWKRAAKRPLHLPPDESDGTARGVVWLRNDQATAQVEVQENQREETKTQAQEERGMEKRAEEHQQTESALQKPSELDLDGHGLSGRSCSLETDQSHSSS